ncbi:MAG: hypothetical protein PWP28_1487 [Oceanotoga sp.]|uniref:hypothetical protein n=1 Tax=Oceanotoga sp. TaxID=2108366 RepID=UPI0026572E3F|nr:hypothetical protein [Oceanotoga sp.]MDN5342612.1 hypothetical protein [Oceanotoga sp.]
MKKTLILIFLTTIATIYAQSLDILMYDFDFQNLLKNSSKEVQYFGDLIKRWKMGTQVRSLENLNYTDEEQKIINILETANPKEFLSLIKSTKSILNEDSKIINSFYLYINGEYYKNTKDYILAKDILSISEKLNNINNKLTPITIYYKNYSGIYSEIVDKETIKNELLYGINEYPENKEIVELFVYYSHKYDDFENIEKLYNIYSNFEKKDELTLLYIADIFKDISQKEKSKEISLNLIKDENENIKRNAYTILGDIEDDLNIKIEYYKKASEYSTDDWELFRKLGLAYYEKDKKEYSNMIRVLLLQSLDIKPDQEDIIPIVNELRKELVMENFIKYFLPLILITFIGLWLIFKYEKKKKEKEKYIDKD